MQEECVFCKLVAGTLPSHKIYEDEYTLAFLDIDPRSPGNTVVIPKRHTEELWDVDDATYQYLLMITKRVGQRIKQVLQPFRVSILVEGMDVPHTHINLIPIDQGIKKVLEDHVTSEPNHEELAAMALRLKF